MIPQESVIGPVLFLQLTNNLPSILHEHCTNHNLFLFSGKRLELCNLTKGSLELVSESRINFARIGINKTRTH